MNRTNQFKGCIIAGAIGDAMGSGYENVVQNEDHAFYPFGKPEPQEPIWQITDDTQLTLATIESIAELGRANPDNIANHFLKLYQAKKLSGIGASTLKALRELEFGGHWSQIGRKGEYAAGNGAAMRAAPLAFVDHISNSTIRDICYITHQNEEAYIGALCVIIAIRSALNGQWIGKENLIDMVLQQIPDTRVKDRLIQIQHMENLQEVGHLGNSGYVVDSIPLALAAANKVTELGIENMLQQLIDIGGDTDTNCSIAGQIAGALIGFDQIPTHLVEQLNQLSESDWIYNTMARFIEK